jgi:hypothetical protein
VLRLSLNRNPGYLGYFTWLSSVPTGKFRNEYLDEITAFAFFPTLRLYILGTETVGD